VAASGLLILDKPTGLTSHDAVQRVRRISGVRRAGHAGTLDPLASGVLLVCVGPATRLVEYLVGHDKTYETTVRLGQATTTYDVEGDITRERPVQVDESQITAALDAFRGPIRQQVPAYSAVKRDGQPLYKSARRGDEVELPVREVVIHSLELLAYEPPLLSLRVVCSAGTYIRSLAHDLGEALGCGGHVAGLRRTAVGEFTLAEAISLDELTPENWQTHLRPPETTVRHLPRLDVDAEEARRLALGQRLPADPSRLAGPFGRTFGPDGCFLGVVAVVEDVWQPKKILVGESTDSL
jgi:tRNA pseudouridine55 synthase